MADLFNLLLLTEIVRERNSERKREKEKERKRRKEKFETVKIS